MTIKEVKENLEKKLALPSLIFVCENDSSRFIPYQYIHEYSNYSNKKIKIIEEIDSILFPSFSIFDSDIETNEIFLFVTDNIEAISSEIYNNKRILFIITNKIDSKISEEYSDIVIKCPELTKNNIKAYAYSVFKGIDEKYIEWFLKCSYNIYRIDNEAKKFKLFSAKERSDKFYQCILDDDFYGLVDKTIFSLTDAIVKKDTNTIRDILSQIDNIDINAVGFTTVLISNFRNIIDIQLNKNPTPENLNMNPKQFAAIRYRTGIYSQNQLIEIYDLLLSVDKWLKTGYLPADMIIDYVIMNILRIGAN